MSKLPRVFQKLFGTNGPNGDFGRFGSLAAGSATYTKDPTDIQSLAAFLTGWAAETIATNRPALEDMNSLCYLMFYQICYLLQQGIPEYDATTVYYIGSVVQSANILYLSLTDNNTGNTPASNPSQWSVYPAAAGAAIVIEPRTNDPSTPATGRIWLRTDL